MYRELLQKMNEQVRFWEEQDDMRVVFLKCYSMMTENMLEAIREQRFNDNAWVERLLHRFAEYYFEALACYDCGDAVPLVWQKVHEASAQRKLHVLQHLLLGVNAHINYDLVLTLDEILRDEWDSLSEEERSNRYADHCMVNRIIGETIDAVQDEVVEDISPYMDMIDKLMGRQDERLLLRLIAEWRDDVWEKAAALVCCTDASSRESFRQDLEKSVLSRARWLQI